ncbi:MAG: disulfide reductase, partial [Deltaproteobacteria bacterium]|nr:disulfide reductase [Deltaproteobacteria bacterium]
MKYYYYPGCSLEGTAKEYDISTRAFMSAMEIELVELEDWTCCGASAAPATGNLLSLALPARNIALAEKTNAA